MSDSQPCRDPETIRALMAGIEHWYHQIELAPGLVTPGTHPSPEILAQLDRLGLPRQARGLRVLDIGCRDGFYAFEMERRGAEVLGIDYAAPHVTGFAVASQILGSRVEYTVENVYNLAPEKHGTFDLVLFLGVLYHLRNPLLALDRIRGVTKAGGMLFVDTQVTSSRWLRLLRIPAWQYHLRDDLNRDATNKWSPNLPGLKAVIEEAQFHVLAEATSRQRAFVRAEAFCDSSLEFFRRLDSSVRMWGESGPNDTAREPEQP